MFLFSARLLAAFALLTPGAALAQFVWPVRDPAAPSPPAVAAPAAPDVPHLEALDHAAIAQRIRMLPDYANAANAHAKVVGAYTIAESDGARFVDAWGVGYLPLNLKRSDGTCFALHADTSGVLSNARLTPVGCDARRIVEKPSAAPLAGSTLRYIDTGWSFSAWQDAKAKETLVTRPWAKTFEPFFAIRMDVFGIAAMNGPDWPGGNVTLAGRIDGRLTIVVLEVAY